MAILLCKIGPTIKWFVQDYHKYSLRFLANSVSQLGLQQNSDILHSELSSIETGRIQRAFCRFETFRYLFAAEKNADVDYQYSKQARHFLGYYAPDDVEEIACIRDYLIMRLWNAFESIEEDALEEKGPDGPIRSLGSSCKPSDWFSYPAKVKHPLYMEYLMSLGLPVLRKVLQSVGLKRADLVIPNSYLRRKYISEALSGPSYVPSALLQDYDDGRYEDEECDFDDDDLDLISRGLLWANRNRVPTDYGRRPLQGLRQWGYVFWDSWRLQASGVLETEYVYLCPFIEILRSP